MDLVQEKDFSVTSSLGSFARNLKLLPTSPALWAGRTNSLSADDAKLRQCLLIDLRWVASVSRPDICARLARIAPKIDAPRGRSLYRVSGLVRVAKERQLATVLRDASSSHPRKALGRGDRPKRDLCNLGEKARCDSMSFLGLSDAAHGGHSIEGERRLGCVIGRMSSALRGPCHILQWPPKFARKLVESILGIIASQEAGG